MKRLSTYRSMSCSLLKLNLIAASDRDLPEASLDPYSLGLNGSWEYMAWDNHYGTLAWLRTKWLGKLATYGLGPMAHTHDYIWSLPHAHVWR